MSDLARSRESESQEENTAEDEDDSSGSAAANIFGAQECARAVQALAAAVSAAPLAMMGRTDELEESVEQMEEFADDAPDDIKKDLAIITAAYKKYGEIVKDSGWEPESGQAPPQAVLDDLEEASEELESGEAKAAQDRVNEWFEEECGSG